MHVVGALSLQVNTVIFDKTGTLTLGKPFVTDVVPIASRALMRLMQASSSSTSYAGEEATVVPGSTEASSPLARTAVLAIAAVCESGSEHPIGRSIVDASHSNSTVEITDACDEPSAAGMGDDAPRQLDLGRNLSQESASSAKPGGIVAPGFVSEPGLGVACRHPLGRVCVGTWSWAASNGKRRKVVERGTTRKMTSLWTPEWSHRVADDIMKKLEAQGKTAVLVALDGEAVGVIAVADTVKEVKLTTFFFSSEHLGFQSEAGASHHSVCGGLSLIRFCNIITSTKLSQQCPIGQGTYILLTCCSESNGCDYACTYRCRKNRSRGRVPRFWRCRQWAWTSGL